MPFWRGEDSPRSAELGAAVGALCREIAGRLDDPELPRWLEDECRLEARATRPLIRYVARQARVAGVVPGRPHDPGRDLSRPGRRARPGGPFPVRRQDAPGAEARTAGPDPRALRHPGLVPAWRRRALDPAARNGRAAAGPARWSDRRRGRAIDPPGAAGDRAFRPAIPPERRPGAAHAPARSRQADAALAATAAGEGPAPGRGQVSRFPDRHRDLPRMPRSRTSSCLACAGCSRRSARGRCGSSPGRARSPRRLPRS